MEEKTREIKFDEFNLTSELLEGLSYMGFETATPIQERAIPIILEGKDLLACAQTGTGKTAAFILPVLNELSKKSVNYCRALVIAPTRELVVQIEQQVQAFAYFANVASYPVYGGGDGQDFESQRKALKAGTDIIIATPGKLISHLNMGYVDFSKMEYLILDEADRMLDMGFLEDILLIASHINKERKTLLFSATMPPKIRTLAKSILKEPEEISIAISKPAEGVLQGAYLVTDHYKSKLIKHLIKGKPNYQSILVFASTKKKVGEVVRELRGEEYEVQAVSSDLIQKDREDALRKFKARTTRVLVATDVLSRGIDIKGINLVINFDVPSDGEDYVHRIGRTARADSTGVALTLINADDVYKFQRIEELIESEIHKIKLPPGFGESPDYSKRPERKKRSFKRKGGGKKGGRSKRR